MAELFEERLFGRMVEHIGQLDQVRPVVCVLVGLFGVGIAIGVGLGAFEPQVAAFGAGEKSPVEVALPIVGK